MQNPDKQPETSEETPEEHTALEETDTGSKKLSVGLVLGIFVIAAIAAGSYYLWRMYMETQGDHMLPKEDAVVTELMMQSDSDALSDIERDLESTDIDVIDQELSEIERTLGE